MIATHPYRKCLIQWLVQYQAGGAVGAAGQFLVEHVEALGVVAEEFHLGDHVAGVGLLFTLLLDKPVEELHGAEVFHFVGGIVDGVDAFGDILFVFQSGLQQVHVGLEDFVGLGDGVEGHFAVVVLHVLVEKHGVVALFLCLDHVPVGEAVEAALLEIVVHVEVQISGVELFIDLLVEQVGNFFVKHDIECLKRLLFLEMCFVYRAERAYPVGGEVFEFGTGGDAVVGVAGCGVIDVTAYVANIFFHDMAVF